MKYESHKGENLTEYQLFFYGIFSLNLFMDEHQNLDNP
ncbi:uncharacterized protein METZ01_LOCUS208060, partial [marine metagenome]